MCKSKKLRKFLDLGNQPLSDGFLTKEMINLGKEKKYPLQVCMCMNCGNLQLAHTVPANEMFGDNYLYESGITKAVKTHFAGLAEELCKEFSLGKDTLVIDIGSNVGALLESFKEHGTKVLGIDPASRVAKIAVARGVPTINEFFSYELARKIVQEYGHAKIITGTNVFAHIDDLYGLMEGINELLDKDGVFVVEVPHFLELVNNLEYDTIYHEHASYILIKPTQAFLQKQGFEIFKIKKTSMHGGTLRIFIARQKTRPVSDSVKEIIEIEKKQKIFSLKKLKQFAGKVKQQKKELIKLLTKLKKQKKKIVGAGAAAKGNTLLNYCKINTNFLGYITDKSELKIGRYTPGTHIPIYNDQKLLEDMPDYVLILAWNFAEEIMHNLSAYKEKGGKFVIPIPLVEVV